MNWNKTIATIDIDFLTIDELTVFLNDAKLSGATHVCFNPYSGNLDVGIALEPSAEERAEIVRMAKEAISSIPDEFPWDNDHFGDTEI